MKRISGKTRNPLNPFHPLNEPKAIRRGGSAILTIGRAAACCRQKSLKMCTEQMLDVVVKFAQVAIAFFAALGAFRFYEWLTRPKLEILFEPYEGQDIQSYYYEQEDYLRKEKYQSAQISIRARVINRGKRSAQNVEVALTDLKRKETGSYRRVRDFLLINLRWSHTKNPEMKEVQSFINPIYISHISPGIPKNFDIATVYWQPEGRLEFDILTQPSTRFWSVSLGDYEFEVTVAASNLSRSQKRQFRICFKKTYSPLLLRESKGFDDFFEIKML